MHTEQEEIAAKQAEIDADRKLRTEADQYALGKGLLPDGSLLFTTAAEGYEAGHNAARAASPILIDQDAAAAANRAFDAAIEQLGLLLALRPGAFEAVREAAKGHEGLYMSSGIATRLISIMDAAKVVLDLALADTRPLIASAPASAPVVQAVGGGEKYLPGEEKMKALGYELYLPNPEKPYPAYVDGLREWEIKDESGHDFIKVYHQYGHVWIGASSSQGHPTTTIYNGVLPNEAFLDQLLKLNGRYPA